jgi:hypothetical protein
MVLENRSHTKGFRMGLFRLLIQHQLDIVDNRLTDLLGDRFCK